MRKKGTWKPGKGRLRQGLGFVLSAAMVMSLPGGSILTAYAAEDDTDAVMAMSDDYEPELDQAEDGYYLIYDENDILSYEEMIENGYEASSARLAGDITVSADSGFTGFGTSDIPYAGTFDGDGHTVTLSISTTGYAGLFSYVSGATIEDVVTAGTVKTSSSYCAGLVAYVLTDNVTVKGCVNKADISGAGHVAGLVGGGYVMSSSFVSITVADCSNEGSITGTGSYVAGIVGIIPDGSITGCTNYGTVTSGSSLAGGIVGEIDSCGSVEVSGCRNEGAVTGGYNQTGGIAGEAYGPKGDIEISDCGNEGTVTGKSSYTGGIVGFIYSDLTTTTLALDGLYNTGDVSGTSYVGGIVGRNGATSISNVYNLGEVSGSGSSGCYTGGIVGRNTRSGAVLSNAYNAGEVTYTSSRTTYTGGLLVGYISSASYMMYVDNVYYLSTLDGSAVASGDASGFLYSDSTQAALTDDEIAAMAKTSEELQNLADTLGDSFEDNWVDTYHGGYPILSWEDNGDDSDAVRYAVISNLENISSNGRRKAAAGSDYTATLTADEYYVLPENIVVTVDGTELVSGEGYAYDAESGLLTIYEAYVTGDIEITATGVATYSVSTYLSNLSSDGASRVNDGTDYTATLSVVNQYFILPENITVTTDGTELVSGEGYAYDMESGLLTIYAAYITGDIVITAEGVLVIENLSSDEEGYYLLYTESDILTFMELVSNATTNLNARLMVDITVSADSDFAGIGTSSAPYAGTFDGNGYTVTLSMSTDGAAGLFAYVSGATIENVTTAGTVETTKNNYGCAGLVSYVMADGVTVKNCVNKADVSGTGYVAGLIGRCSATSVSVTVADSCNEGSITGTGSYAGGIAAYIYNGSVTDCINYGAVSATTYKGGIAGYAYSYGSLEISDCGNEGTVTGSSGYTGGVIGLARGSSSAPLILDGLYNAGTVTGTTYIGGIVGGAYAGMSNVYNTGTISGTAVSTGGIVGNNYLSGTVLSNAYNAGEVTYTSSSVTYAGGLLVGSITSSSYVMYVENAYYLSTLDGSVIASGSDYLYSNSTQAAFTDDELTAMAKTSSVFQGLAGTLGDSFDDNYVDTYHGGYPILSWEDNGADPDAVLYGVTMNLSNISGIGKLKAAAGVDYTAELTAEGYYLLPESITVTAGGTELVSGEGYVYDFESGLLTVYAASVTGDLEITAVGVVTYSVSTSLTNLSIDGDTRAAVCADYTATLSVENQYFILPESITVTTGETELVSGEGYAYDSESGSLTIFAAYITSDIVITAEGVLIIDLTPDEDGCYLLCTEDDIMDFSVLVAFASADLDAKLMADITVSADSSFAGIGTSSAPYAGTFDGNGYTVTLSISTDGAAGLFAYVSGATIENVITAGTVESSVNTYGCAGLVSYVMADGITVKNCVNKADVSGTGYVAGLIGRCSATSVPVTVENSFNEGSITSTGAYAGGIAAYIYNGSITGSLNYGAVTGISYLGGVVGYAYSYKSLEILNCGNEGAITGSSTRVGGIVGLAQRTTSTALTMDNLYNTGIVNGINIVGGIVGGTYTSLSNVYNEGKVIGTTESTGGLIGYNYIQGGITLSNGYNVGEVTYTSSGVTYTGGLLVGEIISSKYIVYVDNAYYLSSLDGSVVASGSSYFYSNATQAALTDDEFAAMAKTSDELAALADTLGDSFVANTDADYHLGYPVLAWEVAGEEGEGGGEEEVRNGLYADDNGTLAYYVDGVIDTTFTGVASDEDGTSYYVENGYVGSYTGLAKDASDGTWYYFTESVLDAEYTGLVKNAANGILYYVSGGTIGWDYTGMAKYAANGCWYYVSGGTIDWTYTGLAKNAANGIWYYFADGALDWSYTGMVKHSNGVWYYVSGGQLDWSFTGDVTTESGTYHFENGTIVWDYTAA